MSDRNVLVVKLTNRTPAAKGPELIRSILGEGAIRHVEPLFPGDEEPDLASLFTVTLARSDSVGAATAALEKDPTFSTRIRRSRAKASPRVAPAARAARNSAPSAEKDLGHRKLFLLPRSFAALRNDFENRTRT